MDSGLMRPVHMYLRSRWYAATVLIFKSLGRILSRRIDWLQQGSCSGKDS